ncbi:MAG: gluconate 2-dehydrogenase gamma chain [Thermomicrobiales bacterium]|nr:gluconate 2-dehydrogenase gamma chain [Thermomicrobiales bacterium]
MRNASKPPRYPSGTVRALLQTHHVSAATRAALTERIDESARPWSPRFFNDAEIATLRAVCARLTAGDDLDDDPDVARTIDDRLAEGRGDGWRFAVLPPDPGAFRLALRGIDESSTALFSAAFLDLSADQQDHVLTTIQRGVEPSTVWQTVEPSLFFQDLLSEVCEIFYGHPIIQEEIGYVGMADLPRWEALGLDALDEREPRPLPGDHVESRS